jgi:NAD+ kinase
MIEARVVTADPGATQIVYEALNEVAIGRREVAGLSMIGVTVDEEPLTTYRADAVIVSTATGSTGYALSAGGPILHPQSEDILITPVAPHLDKSWALVLPKSARVEVSFLSQQPGALAIDGFIDVPIGYGDTVKIVKGESVARFMRGNPPSHYYADLVRKLGLDPWEM